MALDTSRCNGRGGMMLTRRGSWGFAKSNTAVRQIEAEQWLADHAAELAAPEIDVPVIRHQPAEYDEIVDGTWSNTDDGYDLDEDRVHAEALADASERAREAAAEAAGYDPLSDPDLPGWGDTFDPEELQWGFTTYRDASGLPGATSGRPQPAHLAR